MLKLLDFGGQVAQVLEKRGVTSLDHFQLVPSDVPALPKALLGDGLGLLLGRKEYHRNQPSQCVEILADRGTLRALALSVLAVTLAAAEGQEVEIRCPWPTGVAPPEHLVPLDAIVVTVSPNSVIERGRPRPPHIAEVPVLGARDHPISLGSPF